MSQFVLNMSNCPMCASTGPALLPVRYAVVTDNIKVGIPTWAKPQNDFPQAKGYDYALRALRQGFVYVFYEMSHQWDAWAVCEDGSVWKQPSAPYAKNKKTPDCTSPLHNATNVEMMVLRDDALQGNSWLAFSPSKWGPETLERYTSNAEQREKRMQCVESWQWSEPANSEGITAASPGSLENILDYAQLRPSHASFLLPYNPPIKRISQTEKNAPWYKFEEYAVKAQGTLYPWSKSRAGYARRTLQALQVRGKGENRYGNPITPLVVALNDPVGIAHELTGFSDDFAGLHKSWMDDLSIEFTADYWLNGVQKQLKKLNHIQALHSADYNMNIISAMTQGNSTKEDIAHLRDKARLEAIKAGKTEFAHDWAKYTKRLDQEKRKAFLECHNLFC